VVAGTLFSLIGTGVFLAAATSAEAAQTSRIATSAAFAMAQTPSTLAQDPQPAIERAVPTTSTPETSTSTTLADQPGPPVGDPSSATDPAAVLAIADSAELPPPPAVDERSWFLVGDSTFFAAADHIGFGSSFPGVGFARSWPGLPLNPLLDPPDDFDGTVVIGISVWDVGIIDASAYVNAVETYRSAGYPVVIVEVPEGYGPGETVVTSEAEAAGYRGLNHLVASATDCAVAPWWIRDVETLGDVDGGDDHAHPTAVGVHQILANLTIANAPTCAAA